MISGGAPLKLFWWNGNANFGDLISPLVVEYVARRQVAWAEPQDAELFAVGSIMRYAAVGSEIPKPAKPWVWGTGSLSLWEDISFVGRLSFAAVRGPRTARTLNLGTLPFGDPGILIADVLGAPKFQSGDVGIVPHFSQQSDPRFIDVLKQIPDARLIDVTKDPREVVAEIAGCRHIFSSSLHGLVVADAYGIPNTWLNPEGIHRSAKFKFRDYAMAIGRDLHSYVEVNDIPRLVGALTDGPLPYAEQLEAVKRGLKAAFPAELAA